MDRRCKMGKTLLFGILLINILLVPVNTASVKHSLESLLEGVTVREDIDEHTQEFDKPEILKVSEHIYVAVGFGIANSIFILAPEGIIVIDTLESSTAAKPVLKEFRKLFPKPAIKAIVYTHNHGDHNEGTRVYMEDPDNPPDIWAHQTLADAIKDTITGGPVLFQRAARQFGFHLPKDKPYFLNNGIGYRIVGDSLFKKTNMTGLVWPNKFVMGEELDVVLAGLPVKFLHTPGETPDHLGVYIPSMEAFMCGDNLYKTFPNLYAIRGTTLRDPLLWIESLDKMRKLQPNYLLPSHTRPVIGKEVVMNVLTMYRDGIQLVHDQTLRFTNEGYHRDEIANMLTLPPKQKANRYLREHYGTVPWSSKAVFNKYLGWFSGDPVELSPFTLFKEAKRVVKLAGGSDVVISIAKAALEQNNYKWALQLATYIMKLDRENLQATVIRKEALKALAGQQTSPNGRNYYLTNILEDAGVLEIRSKSKARNFALQLPMDQLFRFLSFGIKVDVCGHENIKILLDFTDKQEQYTLHLRNSILVAKKFTNLNKKQQSKVDCKTKVSSEHFREVIGQIKPLDTLWQSTNQGDTCDKLLLKKFLGCFELVKPDYDFGFGAQ